MTSTPLTVTYVAKHTYTYRFQFTDESTGLLVDPSAITFEAWLETDGRFKLLGSQPIGSAVRNSLGDYTFSYDHPKGGTYKIAIDAPSSNQYFAFEVTIVIPKSVREQ